MKRLSNLLFSMAACWIYPALGNIERESYAKMRNKLLSFGLVGSVFAALCCFTPLLPVILTTLGLTSLIGVLYNDVVLLPMLAGFGILTGYAIWRQKKQR